MGVAPMDELNVRADPNDGICTVWAARYDAHNRPCHERITLRNDQVPELIEKLQGALDSIKPALQPH